MTLLLFKVSTLRGIVRYAFSSYRIINVYSRFALGEFIALTFLPLCFYGIYAIFRGNYHDWNYLAIGFSAIILSHVLSAFIDLIFFLCISLILCVHINNIKQRLIAFFKAGFFSFLSSLIFVVPFCEQIFYQKFSQPDKMNLASNSLMPAKLFTESINNNFNRVANGNTYNIGVVLLLVIIVGLGLFKSLKSTTRHIYIIAIISLVLSTSLVPCQFYKKHH